jgi:hypothetical protein
LPVYVWWSIYGAIADLAVSKAHHIAASSISHFMYPHMARDFMVHDYTLKLVNPLMAHDFMVHD